MSVSCPYCQLKFSVSGSRNLIVCSGTFLRKSDSSRQQRFLCRPCKRSFSTASQHPCFGQKKRHLNPDIFKYLASGVSQRRLAILLKVNRKTIVRKFIFLGIHAQQYLVSHRASTVAAKDIEFDDLETFEHSKLKPLSVIMAVESKTRRILGFKLARMPAKGLLVKKSLKKYGPRRDERKKARGQLFAEIKPFLTEHVIIKSDENPHYIGDVKKYFPKSVHLRFKSRRGCVTGQGELKAISFDPIFSLNHTFAMNRANINRLFRRTWNTTKKPERLALHLAIYSLLHNLLLI